MFNVSTGCFMQLSFVTELCEVWPDASLHFCFCGSSQAEACGQLY